MTTSLKPLEPDTIQRFLDDMVQADQAQPIAIKVDDVIADLRAKGVQPGHPVMVAIPNSKAFVAVVFGILALGAVPVLLPSSAPPARIQRIAHIVGASALVGLNISPALSPADSVSALAGVAKFAFIDQRAPHAYPEHHIILLTSGTSGIFSGCLFHINALLLNASRHIAAVGQSASDRVLINLPMYYSYAFVAQLLASFLLNNRTVIAGPPFTPEHYEHTIRQYQITLSSLTPLMVDAWLEAGDQPLPEPLRRMTIGGDALSTASLKALLDRTPGLALYVTYGLTQAGPRVATLAAHKAPPSKYGSVGQPFPDIRVYLRKDHPDDDDGELIVETDSGMTRRITGAEDEPDTPRIGDHRIIHTGDRFLIDDDGYLFFKRRKPSYVMSRGEKVSLKSVSDIAETIPGVARAEAWVHEYDEASGNSLFTLDVYCEDDTLTEGDIRRQLGRTLLRSEQPTVITLHAAADIGWRKTPSHHAATASKEVTP